MTAVGAGEFAVDRHGHARFLLGMADAVLAPEERAQDARRPGPEQPRLRDPRLDVLEERTDLTVGANGDPPAQQVSVGDTEAAPEAFGRGVPGAEAHLATGQFGDLHHQVPHRGGGVAPQGRQAHAAEQARLEEPGLAQRYLRVVIEFSRLDLQFADHHVSVGLQQTSDLYRAHADGMPFGNPEVYRNGTVLHVQHDVRIHHHVQQRPAIGETLDVAFVRRGGQPVENLAFPRDQVLPDLVFGQVSEAVQIDRAHGVPRTFVDDDPERDPIRVNLFANGPDSCVQKPAVPVETLYRRQVGPPDGVVYSSALPESGP